MAAAAVKKERLLVASFDRRANSSHVIGIEMNGSSRFARMA
jgi:hypothetical protein